MTTYETKAKALLNDLSLSFSTKEIDCFFNDDEMVKLFNVMIKNEVKLVSANNISL